MNKATSLLRSLLVASALVVSTGPILADSTNTTKTPKSPELDMARQLNQAFIQVADKISPAVVVITVTQKQSAASADEDDFMEQWRRYFEQQQPQQPSPRNRGRRSPSQQPQQRRAPTGRGSGIVISEDGYILTNNHVVEDAEKITVRLKDGKEYPAEVKGRDPRADIAVIKIKEAKNLIVAKWGDSSAARVGEFALAIGAPFDLDYSVTVGHISAKGRAFAEFGAYADQDFIQTDASINPGNSGGPLVNLYGEVVGINTMIRGIGTGIGFAVPSNIARQVAEHLTKDGHFTRSRIGIEIRDLREDQQYRSVFPDLEDGVVVRGIQTDGPASKSDLKAGDLVVAVDGRPTKTSRDLKEIISYKKPEEMVTLDIVRGDVNGKTKTAKVKVKTEAIPDEDSDGTSKKSSEPAADEAGNFGMTLKGLTKDLADEYGIDETQGVIVTDVDGNSVADEQGIKPGDVITAINHQVVTNLRQFKEAMKNVDKKRGVLINYITKGSSRIAILKDE